MDGTPCPLEIPELLMAGSCCRHFVVVGPRICPRDPAMPAPDVIVSENCPTSKKERSGDDDAAGDADIRFKVSHIALFTAAISSFCIPSPSCFPLPQAVSAKIYRHMLILLLHQHRRFQSRRRYNNSNMPQFSLFLTARLQGYVFVPLLFRGTFSWMCHEWGC